MCSKSIKDPKTSWYILYIIIQGKPLFNSKPSYRLFQSSPAQQLYKEKEQRKAYV